MGGGSVVEFQDPTPKPSGVKIRIEQMTKVFGSGQRQVTAVQDFNLEVRQGEFLVIVGPSGCGKSTVLRILAGLETASSGRYEIARTDPTKPENALVFQDQSSVLPWMTVEANVAYGMEMRGVPKAERLKVANHYIDRIGLSEFRHAYPHQLSGGMKQRVSVARAFSTDPEVLLMDEPFGALDEQTRIILQEELLRIWDENHKTVVFITHSIDEALLMGDRVVVMTARPGTTKSVFNVNFPRPRQLFDLKADPEFGKMSREIWHLLKEEVLRAREGRQ